MGPGLGLRGVLHRSASEDTEVWTALARGGPPERQNLRRRGATHGGGAASLWPDDGHVLDGEEEGEGDKERHSPLTRV